MVKKKQQQQPKKKKKKKKKKQQQNMLMSFFYFLTTITHMRNVCNERYPYVTLKFCKNYCLAVSPAPSHWAYGILEHIFFFLFCSNLQLT